MSSRIELALNLSNWSLRVEITHCLVYIDASIIAAISSRPPRRDTSRQSYITWLTIRSIRSIAQLIVATRNESEWNWQLLWASRHQSAAHSNKSNTSVNACNATINAYNATTNAPSSKTSSCKKGKDSLRDLSEIIPIGTRPQKTRYLYWLRRGPTDRIMGSSR